jgi:hypothetical protein
MTAKTHTLKKKRKKRKKEEGRNISITQMAGKLDVLQPHYFMNGPNKH